MRSSGWTSPTPAYAAVPHHVLHAIFAAAWRQISRVRLAPGDRLGPRELADSEVMLYVERGSGRATAADGEQIELVQDSAITLLRGERLDIEAALDGEGLDLYLVEIGAPLP